MNWQDIWLSPDRTHFTVHGKMVFGKIFQNAMMFHPPGFAPVLEGDRWYFIDVRGKKAFPGRFWKAWGFYCDRAAVEDGSGCYHIQTDGLPAYPARYTWCGNFQEYLCTVRDPDGRYFHIDPHGQRAYAENYLYAGDYCEGFACVMRGPCQCLHIDRMGASPYVGDFCDVGPYHKGYATARDAQGWFHINLSGQACYAHRFALLEPFYNGWAWAEDKGGRKFRVNAEGALDPFHISPKKSDIDAPN